MGEKQTEVKPEEPASTPGAATSVEHIAPEEQYASGGQHKEQKKALEENVKDEQQQPAADQSAGVHSTGSFTGTANNQKTPGR